MFLLLPFAIGATGCATDAAHETAPRRVAFHGRAGADGEGDNRDDQPPMEFVHFLKPLANARNAPLLHQRVQLGLQDRDLPFELFDFLVHLGDLLRV